MEIQELKSAISTKLFNILTLLKIETTEELVKIDLLKFSKIKGVGRKTVTEIYELRKKLGFVSAINEIVDLPIEHSKNPIIRSLPNDEVGKVEFQNIEKHLPRRLFVKLKKIISIK